MKLCMLSMIRNKIEQKKAAEETPSPIKLAPLPLNAYEGKLNKEVFGNEIDRAKLETLEQVGFLWDENEDNVEMESRIHRLINVVLNHQIQCPSFQTIAARGIFEVRAKIGR